MSDVTEVDSLLDAEIGRHNAKVARDRALAAVEAADDADDDETVMDVEDRDPPVHEYSSLPVIRPRRRARVVTTATRQALEDGLAGKAEEFVQMRADESAVHDALKSAAIRLRDAEIEVRAAQKAYGDALQAFNRFVAPVPQ